MKTHIYRRALSALSYACLYAALLITGKVSAQSLLPSMLAPPMDIMQEVGGSHHYQTTLLSNGDLIVYGEASSSVRTHHITTHYLNNGTAWIQFDMVTGDGQTFETCRIHDVPGFTSTNIRGIDYVDPASIDLSNYSIINTTYETKDDEDLLIARLDRDGQSLWTQTIGSAGFDSWGPASSGARATLTSDGHIVLVFSQSATDGDHNRLALTKVDLTDGSIVWSKRGPLNVHMRDDFITDIVELADGSLMATGSAIKFSGNSAYAIHFDATGNYLKSHILNGGGNGFYGQSVVLNSQQELLFQGESFVAGVRRTKITQLDPTASSILWNRQLELTNPSQSSYRIITSPMLEHANGYVGFGKYEGGTEHHALLFQLDNDGNILWSRAYDFSAGIAHSDLRTALIASNGNLLLAGTVGSQTLLTEVDLSTGSVLWAKAFGELYKHIPVSIDMRTTGEIVLTNLISSGNMGLRVFHFNEAGEANDSYNCEIFDITSEVQLVNNVMSSTAVSTSISADLGYSVDSLTMSAVSTPKGTAFFADCTKIGFACEQEPIIWANPSPTENYVHTQTFRVPVKDDADIIALSFMREKQESITYYDGLGRTIQTSAVGMSPGKHDVIQPLEYDFMGRNSLQYLPYTSDAVPGEYVSGILGQTAFYMNLYPSESAYSETKFEASPLSRPIEQSAPGTTWNLAQGHTMKTAYVPYGDPVLPIDLIVPYFPLGAEIWDQADFSEYKKITSGNSDSDLHVTISIDENNHKRYTFIDKMGKTIMQSVEIGPDEHDPLAMVFANTLYIYDEFSRIKYIIQPQGFEEMLGFNGDLHMDLMQSFAFWYEYDAEGRTIMKKVPGAYPVYMVYDNLDRPILIQDGKQSVSDTWSFSKFDRFGRIVMTGECVIPYNGQYPEAARDMLQATVDAFEGALFESRSGLASANNHGYTDAAFPSTTGANVLSVTYYDDYGFDPSVSYQYENRIPGNQPNLNLKGMVTGVKVRVLHDDPNDPNETHFLTTITFYDDRMREIQTQAQNLFGWDVSTMHVNFAGEVVRTVLRHQGPNDSDLLLVEDFCYDHRGELINITHESPDGVRAGITSYEFDELGRNTVKHLHSIDGGQTALQKVDHTYNIRNWLTHINKASTSFVGELDLFSMNLLYEEGFTNLDPAAVGQFNGNISGWTWQIAGDEQSAYAYTYDHANRLLSGKYAQQDPSSTQAPWAELIHEDNYSLQEVRYDLNGNIQRLRRRGPIDIDSNAEFVFGMMDDLTYDYFDGWNGNQVSGISDFHPDLPNVAQFMDGHTAGQPEASWDYHYDENGNMIEDRNKGVTVEYNFMNKPETITFDGGESIHYLYDASGKKLRKIASGQGNTSMTDYLGAFHYTDQSLEFYTRAEGRVLPDGNGGFDHQYHLTDHLGNTRVTFGDLDEDGSIDPYTELLQSEEYYPFGLSITGNTAVATSPVNHYLYNGKELQPEFGLGWYDYGARMYDPSMGRWNGVDALAEVYQVSTPYNYTMNNPIRFIDPDGNSIMESNPGSDGDYPIGFSQMAYSLHLDYSHTVEIHKEVSRKKGNKVVRTITDERVNLSNNGEIISTEKHTTIQESIIVGERTISNPLDGMQVKTDILSDPEVIADYDEKGLEIEDLDRDVQKVVGIIRDKTKTNQQYDFIKEDAAKENFMVSVAYTTAAFVMKLPGWMKLLGGIAVTGAIYHDSERDNRGRTVKQPFVIRGN